MSEARVTQLGYIELEVRDQAGWERFATRILGLQAMNAPIDCPQFLRMDENHHRIAVSEGPADDVAHLGWEVGDERAMSEIADRLIGLGFIVKPGTAELAGDRMVDGLVQVVDPDGITNEIYHGPWQWDGGPFRSSRGLAGFNAGPLGMGHVALSVGSYDASMSFYREGLGLRTSDYIDLDLGDASLLVGFLNAGPRHHSVALVEIESERRLHHIMLELLEFDDVGKTYDLCQDEGIPIVSSMGTHTNDGMTSFYIETPSGFQIEYGTGGHLVDDNWQITTHTAASTWGHRARTETPLLRPEVAI